MAQDRSGERAAVAALLGYLNFAAGAPDPTFLRNVDRVFADVLLNGDLDAIPTPAPQVLQPLAAFLRSELERLGRESSVFADARQAAAVIDLVFDELLPAYRAHHSDLLFHQTDEGLFNSYFIARACEAVLSQGGPWDERGRIVAGALKRLNDYLGYRPLAVLNNNRQTDPYPHERIRPVPLYVRGAGPAAGPYRLVIEKALEILSDAEPSILQDAEFSLEALDELSVDPRAYDFGHPVNRRPNYQFGEWDPHVIDSKGSYRRFVLRQVTLDALCSRGVATEEAPLDEMVFEAGAVLAGVLLMASGTSGSGPERYDSNVTLTSLVARIAGYRDRFYHQQLAKLTGPHGERLLAEAERAKQPFGGARQHLNRFLARLRATQLQHIELARIFAEIGDEPASRRNAHVIPVARGRMLSEIGCEITLAHHDLDARRLVEAANRLPHCEDVLKRAVDCGAFVDPWNILGFGGQFSVFHTVESSGHDPRVDELVEIMEKLFNLYVRIISDAAAAGTRDLVERLLGPLESLAGWWDKFATDQVSSVGGVSGRDSVAAAKHLADILGRWRDAGEQAGAMTFWRAHLDRFTTPKSYALVIEALLNRRDHTASLALLMQWLGKGDDVPLEQDAFSFYNLAMRWFQGGDAVEGATNGKLAHNWTQVRKFFDFLEANAEEYWDVPSLDLGYRPAPPAKPQKPPLASAGEDGPDDGGPLDEDEDEEDIFKAAYEGVIFRDSTRDGNEGETLPAGGSPSPDADEWLQRSQQLGRRLRFITSLAELWRAAVVRHSPDPSDKSGFELWRDSLRTWWRDARDKQGKLLTLLEAVQTEPKRSPGTPQNSDALVEDDRRRRIQSILAQDVLTAWLAAERAATTMLVALPEDDAAELIAESELATWQRHVMTLERAARRGDVPGVELAFPDVVEAIRRQPLLYVPLSKGGEPRKVASVQRIQHVLRDLLRLLPRLGLFRETYRLIETCREMERNFPAGARAVTEFDRLFQIGFQAVVEQLALNGGGSAPPLPDDQLVQYIGAAAEGFATQWLQHSQSVRLSVVERINDDEAWRRVQTLIHNYGKEIFVTQFVNLGHLRSVLHQGLANYVKSLLENEDPDEIPDLFRELGKNLPREQTLADVELIMESVAENYDHYKDYNSTTTQSDSGDNLYIFLDFLRLKSGYERLAWHLKPYAWAHDMLVRFGRLAAADHWRKVVEEKTADRANWHLKCLNRLETKYSVQLPTIGDRIRERFVRPFQLDRIRALVRPAVQERRNGESGKALEQLEREIEAYAATPTGSGLDVPQWLVSLASEVREASQTAANTPALGDWLPEYPRIELSHEELRDRLSDWMNNKTDEA